MNVFENGLELKTCPVCGHHFISYAALDAFGGHCSAECLVAHYNAALDTDIFAVAKVALPNDSTECNNSKPPDDSTKCNVVVTAEKTLDKGTAICKHCGETFTKWRDNQIFCSTACRTKHNSELRKKKEPSLTNTQPLQKKNPEGSSVVTAENISTPR